jgi:hypothetical protein
MDKLAYYKKHFDIYTINGKGGKPDQHFVVHRIRTTLSLSIIRHDQKIFQALQENNVFLGCNYFQEDKWNTVNLGFMLFLDPSKHHQDDARQMVLNMASQTDYGNAMGDGDKFQLVAGTRFLYIGGHRVHTKAYTVVCLRQHTGRGGHHAKESTSRHQPLHKILTAYKTC